MERKRLEDLIQHLWDEGASIDIMKILQHDKQQREIFNKVYSDLVYALGLLKQSEEYLKEPYPYGAYTYGQKGTAKRTLDGIDSLLAKYPQIYAK